MFSGQAVSLNMPPEKSPWPFRRSMLKGVPRPATGERRGEFNVLPRRFSHGFEREAVILSLPAYYTAPPGAPGTELKLSDILGGAWTPLGNGTISEVSTRPPRGLREDAGGKWNAATSGTRVG